MNPDGEVAEAVRELIRGPIESIDQVQLLAMLGESPDREWTAAEAAAESRLGLGVTRAYLRAMADAQLISWRSATDRECFRAGAVTDALRGAVGELLAMYNQRPVTLVRAIYARVPTRARTFSEPYSIPRPDGDRD